MPAAPDRQRARQLIEERRGALEARRDGGADDRLAAHHAVRTAANSYIFDAATQSIGHDMSWEFFCECGDPNCRARIELTVHGYEGIRKSRRPILARGHQQDQKVRSRALRDDARALLAQAQHQIRRAKKNVDRDEPHSTP